MGLLQKLVIGLLPKKCAQAVEKQAREWLMRGPCGAEISIWDAGGIRFKAAGQPVGWQCCSACGQWTGRQVGRRGRAAAP